MAEASQEAGRGYTPAYKLLPLPDDWEEIMTDSGRPCFVNHTTTDVTWVDPRDNPRRRRALPELPYGWTKGWAEDIGIYYIDHINRVNTQKDPRLLPELQIQYCDRNEEESFAEVGPLYPLAPTGPPSPADVTGAFHQKLASKASAPKQPSIADRVRAMIGVEARGAGSSSGDILWWDSDGALAPSERNEDDVGPYHQSRLGSLEDEDYNFDGASISAWDDNDCLEHDGERQSEADNDGPYIVRSDHGDKIETVVSMPGTIKIDENETAKAKNNDDEGMLGWLLGSRASSTEI